MKFKDSASGKVFSNVYDYIYDEDTKRKCAAKGCRSCPISIDNNEFGQLCPIFSRNYPERAASLLGLEIIREAGIDFPMPEYDPAEVSLKKKEKKPFVNAEIEFIREHLSERAILEQLAEEATELAKASLKLIRACSHENPTPVTPEEAYIGIIEECADISNCLVAMGFDTNKERWLIAKTMREKQQRWVERIKELQGGAESEV